MNNQTEGSQRRKAVKEIETVGEREEKKEGRKEGREGGWEEEGTWKGGRTETLLFS